jgi:hypothetical protein
VLKRDSAEKFHLTGLLPSWRAFSGIWSNVYVVLRDCWRDTFAAAAALGALFRALGAKNEKAKVRLCERTWIATKSCGERSATWSANIRFREVPLTC